MQSLLLFHLSHLIIGLQLALRGISLSTELLFSAGEPKGTWQESWKAMEDMHRKGKIRSLGVSNFDLQDLEELVKLATVPVSAVQNWFDPFHQDLRIREFCQEHNIRYIGYSTLGEFFCR